ncbi:hypothetical protein FIE12Z_810 [Fusarium flagelliforme]|uniref:GIY-YIG domain-containing protein n=1 Tax=Fusarium flagelliforme TaxID=2675880 RepID=A0A395N5A0_9HYPO|nr:hypothetical protein FIE12Z_810 [Fusarium flagelliforme]
MTDLLFQEFPPIPSSSQTPQAIVLQENYEYDDTAPPVPPEFQNHVPHRMKHNGKLRLYKNEQGFLYMRNPAGDMGIVLFIRDGIHLHLVLPLRIMIIGTEFRPLLDKQQDQQPIVVTLTSGSSLQSGSTKLKRYLRTFWNCARHDTTTVMPLGLYAERYAELFSDANFMNNVNTIQTGIVPEAERVLRNGSFSLDNLLGLPDATTYSNSCQVIYLRIYIDLDGSGSVGFYVGQSHSVVRRMKEHEAVTTSGGREQRSCHYRVARKTTEDNRYAVVLCSWDSQNKISLNLLAIAEQTMMSLFDSYNSWISSSNPDTTFTTELRKTHNQAVYIKSVANEAKQKVGW